MWKSYLWFPIISLVRIYCPPQRELSAKFCLQMTVDEFKRQVQDEFAVVLSWHEVRALQKLYGEPGITSAVTACPCRAGVSNRQSVLFASPPPVVELHDITQRADETGLTSWLCGTTALTFPHVAYPFDASQRAHPHSSYAVLPPHTIELRRTLHHQFQIYHGADETAIT